MTYGGASPHVCPEPFGFITAIPSSGKLLSCTLSHFRGAADQEAGHLVRKTVPVRNMRCEPHQKERVLP